uniref:NACHT, LRR and PYD domains-containing protein 12-like isoform X2 n=1 Tax=Myxine glutinosa TaxID=7769 RepID=UPI00358F736E
MDRLWVLRLIFVMGSWIESQSSSSCPENQFLHVDGFCCEFCPIGTSMRMPCLSHGTQSLCFQCRGKTYMDQVKHNATRCKQCSVCDPESEVEERDCNFMNNRQCVCREGLHRKGNECVMKGQSVSPLTKWIWIPLLIGLLLITSLIIIFVRKRRLRQKKVGVPSRSSKNGNSSTRHLLRNNIETDFVVVQTEDESNNLEEIPARRKAQKELKEELLKNFRTIQDYNASPGECTRIEDRFVEPIIVKSEPEIEVESQEHEMRAPSRKKINKDQVSREDLFEQNESSVQHVTKMVMFGSPGIGKSTLCKKLVVDWAEEDEKMKNKFDFVILLKCRNLNHISTETTLKKILLNEYPSLQEVVDDLMENASRVLLVLDALDEMKHPLDFDNVCESPQEANKVGSIIAGLLQGTLLRHGTLLVTTRLVGLQWLHHVCYDPISTYMVEIVGFSHEKTEEFFEKFYRNKDKAKQVLQYLSENDVLSSLCFNPVFCWITATCLSRNFDSHEGSTRDPLPKTMTELFSLYLHLHLEHHGGESITSSADSLLRLCRLAFHGVKERKILFSEEDLKSEGITQSSALLHFLQRIRPGTMVSRWLIGEGITKPHPAFLSEVFLKTEVESVCHYEFFHLTVQEFFAALYFVLPQCKESMDEVFLRSKNRDDDRFQVEVSVDEVFVRSKNRDDDLFQVVQQFVSGLFADKPRRTLGRHFKLSTKPKHKIHSWLQEHKHKDLNCFHCVFELQDVEFTKTMMKDLEFEDLTQYMTSPLDCTVVVYALQTANKPVDSWSVELGSTDVTQRMKILAPAFPLCEKLEFNEQSIGDEGLDILMKSLVSKPNRLKEIRLEDCKLSNKSGPILRDLKNITHLEELHLDRNPIGDEGLEGLMEGLKSQTKLRTLGLGECNLSTKSGPILRELNNIINLEYHELEECDLSTKSGPILRDLKNINNLEELYLGWNLIGDAGLEGLMEVLKSQTKLRILRLRKCKLSPKSGPILWDLKNINNLEDIDLSLNPIGDEGLEGLMEGLKSQTKLRTLRLEECDLSTKSGPILRDLKNIINLEYLSLSRNPIGDEGLKGLMEVLKSQTKLRTLRLEGCNLSTRSGPILRDLKNIINLEDLFVRDNDPSLDRVNK